MIAVEEDDRFLSDIDEEMKYITISSNQKSLLNWMKKAAELISKEAPSSQVGKSPLVQTEPHGKSGFQQFKDKLGRDICMEDGIRVACKPEEPATLDQAGKNETKVETPNPNTKVEQNGPEAKLENISAEPAPPPTEAKPIKDMTPEERQKFDDEWNKEVEKNLNEIESNDVAEHEYTAQEIADEQNWHQQYIDWAMGRKGTPISPQDIGTATRFISGLMNPAFTDDYTNQLVDKHIALQDQAHDPKLANEITQALGDENKSKLIALAVGPQARPIIRQLPFRAMRNRVERRRAMSSSGGLEQGWKPSEEKFEDPDKQRAHDKYQEIQAKRAGVAYESPEDRTSRETKEAEDAAKKNGPNSLGGNQKPKAPGVKTKLVAGTELGDAPKPVADAMQAEKDKYLRKRTKVVIDAKEAAELFSGMSEEQKKELEDLYKKELQGTGLKDTPKGFNQWVADQMQKEMRKEIRRRIGVQQNRAGIKNEKINKESPQQKQERLDAIETKRREKEAKNDPKSQRLWERKYKAEEKDVEDKLTNGDIDQAEADRLLQRINSNKAEYFKERGWSLNKQPKPPKVKNALLGTKSLDLREVSQKHLVDYFIKSNENCHWVTLKESGTHICIDGAGKVDKGPKTLAGKPLKKVSAPKVAKVDPKKIEAPKIEEEKPKEIEKAPNQPEAVPEGFHEQEVAESLPKVEEPKVEKKQRDIKLVKENYNKDRIKDVLGEEPSSEEFATMLGVPEGKSTIKCQTKKNPWSNNYEVEVSVSGEGYEMHRKFLKDKNGDVFCKNEEIRVNPKGTGLGLRIFSEQVQSLSKEGKVKKIKCYAAGSGGEDAEKATYIGFKVWPKFGYDGPLTDEHKNEWRRNPDAKKYNKANTIQELYAMPGGKEIWEKYGSGIELEFDLSPNSKSMQTLNKYMEMKKNASRGT